MEKKPIVFPDIEGNGYFAENCKTREEAFELIKGEMCDSYGRITMPRCQFCIINPVNPHHAPFCSQLCEVLAELVEPP